MEPGSDVNKVESIFLEEKKCGSFCYMYLVKRGGGLTLCILRNSWLDREAFPGWT
jgi:hypothetical protein